MKRFWILFLYCFIQVCIYAQIGVGIRDTKYANLFYVLKEHYTFKLEHSIFSGKIGTQYLRGVFAYQQTFGNFQMAGSVYYGSPYNGSYYNGGIKIDALFHVMPQLGVTASLNPHYDSYYHYETCFMAGISVKVHRDIDVIAQYTTVPEFRQKENRGRLGVNFHVKNLWVEPSVSIPTTGPIKTIRMLVDFGYVFKKK